MGGMLPFDQSDEDKFIEPDPKAYNNVASMDSAKYLYDQCQQMGVPLQIVSRFAVVATALERQLFDTMKSLGTEIGDRLRFASARVSALQHA